MGEKLGRYGMKAILEGAENMTGNSNFMQIRQELQRLWDLEDLAKTVCSGFPKKFVENYPYSKSLSLEEQIKRRTADTVKLLGMLNNDSR